MNKVIKSYKIDRDFIDTRLDRFIKIKISKLPQSLIEKNLRKKNILVNKKKSKSSYKLLENDIVDFLFEPELSEVKKKKIKKINNSDLNQLKKNIVFECNDYIILNKPYGIASQDGLKVKKNLIDILNLDKEKYYIVHRLDIETIGLMIFAKNREYAKKFSDLFYSRMIKKKYYVIINGQIRKNKGELITTELQGNKEVTSSTLFEVKSKNKNFSFLDVEILTGRKHQIRKQFSDLDHPVVGDQKYGDKKNKINLCLCSYYLEFEHKGKIKSYSIDLPDFMQNFIQKSFYNF